MNKRPRLLAMVSLSLFMGVQAARGQGLGEVGALLSNTQTRSHSIVQATAHGTSVALTQAIQLFNSGEKMIGAGNPVVGENILKQSLGYWESGAKNQDPYRYLKTLNILATLSKKNGKTGDAEDYYRRGISIAAKVYGGGSAELEKQQLLLAEACEMNKKFPDAVALYKQVLMVAERKGGIDDILAVPLREKLIKCCEKGGNYAEAEVALKRLVEFKQASGAIKPGSADKDLKKYIEVLRKVGKEQDAMALAGSARAAGASPPSAVAAGSSTAAQAGAPAAGARPAVGNAPSVAAPAASSSAASLSVPPLGSAENPILLPDDPIPAKK